MSLAYPILLGLGATEGWNDAGLLRVLADVVPRALVSPVAERHLREKLTEQEAYNRALAAVTTLRQAIMEAVEAGRVRVLGEAASAHQTAFNAGANEDEEMCEPASDTPPTVAPQLRALTAPVERLLGQAKAHD